MRLEFKRLREIPPAEYVALNTDARVMRQMPLSRSDFDEAMCREWMDEKARMWAEHGYGPWAFVVDGRFAGWGGVQPEAGEPGLGLVLHPEYWGRGRAISEEIIRRAFGELGLDSVTILFPPTRTRVQGIRRIGFVPDGEVELDGVRFLRYRLSAAAFGARVGSRSAPRTSSVVV